MSDFSNYEEQGLQFGRTVRYEVTELTNPDGTHPALHVEIIGTGNASWTEELLARAKAEPSEEASGRIIRADAENRDSIIRHSARKLENAFFRDGTQATDADIPGFVRAMPVKAVLRLLAFVTNESNFCKYPITEKPAALAEK